MHEPTERQWGLTAPALPGTQRWKACGETEKLGGRVLSPVEGMGWVEWGWGGNGPGKPMEQPGRGWNCRQEVKKHLGMRKTFPSKDGLGCLGRCDYRGAVGPPLLSKL